MTDTTLTPLEQQAAIWAAAREHKARLKAREIAQREARRDARLAQALVLHREKQAAAREKEMLRAQLRAEHAADWAATLAERAASRAAREAKALLDAPRREAKAAQAEVNRQRREVAFKRAEVGRRAKAGEVHRQRRMELDYKLSATAKADDSDQPNSDYAQLRAIAVAPENFVFFEQRLPFFDKTAGWDDDTE